MADVQLDNITKAWGTTAAVENVAFTAPAGHLVALELDVGDGADTLNDGALCLCHMRSS